MIEGIKTRDPEKNLYRALSSHERSDMYLQQLRVFFPEGIVVLDSRELPFTPFLLGHKVDVVGRMATPEEDYSDSGSGYPAGFSEVYDPEKGDFEVYRINELSWGGTHSVDWFGHFIIDWKDDSFHVLGFPVLTRYGWQHIYAISGKSQPDIEALLSYLEEQRKSKCRALISSTIFTDTNKGEPRPEKSWDDIVLADGVRETIEGNFDAFFAARETYKKYSIPYRRGIILVGPPGEGKTSIIRALSSKYREFAFFLYGFSSDNNNLHYLQQMLKRAQSYAPSVVILEDIDRVTGANFMRLLLNTLDGLVPNEGIMIIATSNNPEKLDAALVDRPSRFDLVIRIDAPEIAQRRKYLSKVFSKVLELTEEQLDRLARDTKGYSMANLQELCTGSLLLSVNKKEQVTFEDILASKKQMDASMRTAHKIIGKESASSVSGFAAVSSNGDLEGIDE